MCQRLIGRTSRSTAIWLRHELADMHAGDALRRGALHDMPGQARAAHELDHDAPSCPADQALISTCGEPLVLSDLSTLRVCTLVLWGLWTYDDKVFPSACPETALGRITLN